ncbi:MAG: hypothetical protein J3Q66DRAFT_427707 [Benniella sp.]|nr:MAG: hypothetical protein J3Q66DRAFT_427707 [Benniella sp.]
MASLNTLSVGSYHKSRVETEDVNIDAISSVTHDHPLGYGSKIDITKPHRQIRHADPSILGGKSQKSSDKTQETRPTRIVYSHQGRTSFDRASNSGAFFISYCLFEMPSNMILVRLGPRVWIPIIMFIWGSISLALAWVTSFKGLVVMRFALGAAEAGFVPGVLFYSKLFYKRSEHSFRMAISLCFNILAGAFGGLLAAGISCLSGKWGLQGWQWIFILEAVPLGIPHLSSWKQTVAALTDARVYLICVCTFFLHIASSGVIMFMPSLILDMGFKATTAQLLTTPPYMVAAGVSLLIPWWSDRSKCEACSSFSSRYLHLLSSSFWLKYLAVILALCGMVPTGAVLTSWLTNNVIGHTKRATSLAMVVSSGALASMLGTQVYRAENAPRYRARTSHNSSSSQMDSSARLETIQISGSLSKSHTIKSSLKRPYASPTVFEGAGASHELDYIPFAKTSSTIVKQVGGTAVASEDQWLSDYWDDAKVPRMGDLDYENYRSSPVGPRFSGGLFDAAPPVLSNPEPEPEPEQRTWSSTGNATHSSVNIGPDLQQRLLQRQTQYHPRQRYMHQGFPQSVLDQPGVNSSEVVLEMPPPKLGNRRPRKLSGSWSLNDRYSRMMRDMELLVNSSATPQLGNTTMRSDRSIAVCHASPDYGPNVYSHGYHDAPITANTSYGGGTTHPLSSNGDGVPQLIQEVYEAQPFAQSPWTAPPSMATAFAPNKRARVDVDTNLNSLATSLNPAIGCGAFSTPHFRLSSGCGSSNSGRICEEGITHRTPNIESIQSSGDSFEDDPVFERILEQELVLDDLTHGETSLPCDAHPTSGSLEFQNGAQGDVSPQWPQSTVNIETSFGETLNQDGRLEINNSEGEQPRSEAKCVLDERPLTIRDRIHKMGYEIRASAAASIPRFGITIPTSLDIRQKRDVEKEREMQRLRLMSRFDVFDGIGQDRVDHKGGNRSNTGVCTHDNLVRPSVEHLDPLRAPQETGALKDPNVATRIRTALPTQLPPIDENTALLLPAAITDRDVDLDRISVLEQEIEDLTAFTEQ